MKKISALITLLFVLVIPVLVWTSVASAQSFRTGNNTNVASNETLDSSLWISGTNIDIAGTVNGDVFCAAMNVTISGTINGDVICAAQTMRIAGEVNGDVRIAAQNATVGEGIAGDLTVAAQSFNLEGNAEVGRDVSVAATNAAINGAVGRDLILRTNTATITGEVKRNVEARLDRLDVNSSAVINGNVTYSSPNEARIAQDARVSGEIIYNQPHVVDQEARPGIFLFWAALYVLVSMLLLAVVLVLLFPRFFWRGSDLALAAPLKVFAVGLVASLVFPALFIGLLFTVIGIPLALLFLLLWCAVAFLSGPFFAFYIGRLLIKGRGAFLTILLGGLLVLLAYMVPVAGLFVLLLSHLMGTGMILLGLWHARSYTRDESKVTAAEPMQNEVKSMPEQARTSRRRTAAAKPKKKE